MSIAYYLGMNESRSVTIDLQKLKEWMRRERWNQTTLARRLKIDQGTMSRYMRGVTNPPYPVIIALCALSGMSESELTRRSAA